MVVPEDDADAVAYVFTISGLFYNSDEPQGVPGSQDHPPIVTYRVQA